MRTRNVFIGHGHSPQNYARHTTMTFDPKVWLRPYSVAQLTCWQVLKYQLYASITLTFGVTCPINFGLQHLDEFKSICTPPPRPPSKVVVGIQIIFQSVSVMSWSQIFMPPGLSSIMFESMPPTKVGGSGRVGA